MSAELTRLLVLPGVAEAVDAAREACTQLRWHQALRRRIPEVAAESRVRGARASAFLEGAEFPVSLVRDVIRGAVTLEDDGPGERVLRGAIQATAATEQLRSVALAAPAQALARLHTAAATGLAAADQLGRPRLAGEISAELTDVGPAPEAAPAATRLRGVVELIGSAEDQPGVLVAGIAHAELASARPFVQGNGLVARALERVLLQVLGVDPTGVVVSEAGYSRQGAVAYQGALAAYVTGRPDGVGLWLQHYAAAVIAGAAEASDIADAVLAGRLTAG
jgi:Fic family protein